MKLCVAFAAAVIALSEYASGEERRVCHYATRSADKLHVQQMVSVGDDNEEEYGPGKITENQEECQRYSDHCYAFWREDTSPNNTGGIIYIAQGCWEASGIQDCEASECISKRRPPKALNNTNFCCCTGNYCNSNATYVEPEDENLDPILEPIEMVAVERLNLALVTVVVALGIMTLAVLLLAIRVYYNRRTGYGKAHHENVHLIDQPTLFANSFNPDDLKLEAVIGHGRYGTVWRGTIGEQQVAVKVVQPHNRVYFLNERDAYCLPFMNHPSLLTYFGCDERNGPDGSPELMLMVSLCSLGSLQHYLRDHTLDWATFCRMSLSIAAGLAHLHTDIRRGDKMKPCLSHRDFNSNNILVKDDLSCVICDLGFATQINGSKYYFNGEEQHAETKSITDVGTLRYMCPEVLEGAVNLRDCETSLKQIDVYALGLVLWELAVRCSDFYPNGIECAPYRLPFEAEIGHPTLEHMQVLVCRHKARPLFPDLWRDSAAVRTVRETIEDCWDHDAEARLTALCVEERFHELTGFTQRQKVFSTGISPMGRGSGLIQKESHNVFDLEDKDDIIKDMGGGDSCQSEATIDTIITITPTNPQINCKNSNQLYGYCPSLQPYQGRNPCLERNLMAPRDGDSSSGELIDKSHKHVSAPTPAGPLVVTPPPSVDYTNVTAQQPPAPLPVRANLPIPFVQNVNSENAQPKLSNLLASNARKSTWKRFRQALTGRSHSDALISNESAINVSSPVEDKLHTKVELSNGRAETQLAEMPGVGSQRERRPNTLPISPAVSLRLSNPTSTAAANKLKTRSVVEAPTHLSQQADDPFKCSEQKPQLKEVSCRVKTPGDMPLAVRKVRGQKNLARFSLYDDRIMSGCYDNDNLYAYPEKSSAAPDAHRSSLDDTQFAQDIN